MVSSSILLTYFDTVDLFIFRYTFFTKKIKKPNTVFYEKLKKPITKTHQRRTEKHFWRWSNFNAADVHPKTMRDL